MQVRAFDEHISEHRFEHNFFIFAAVHCGHPGEQQIPAVM
jgi:hypothetical protein